MNVTFFKQPREPRLNALRESRLANHVRDGERWNTREGVGGKSTAAMVDRSIDGLRERRTTDTGVAGAA